ncbi:hypothetical protein BHE74_00051344 [Ensete ventricosum]|nr:hypothetical protein BHE74_00051344 [Ensete ventricosum]
MSICAHSSRVLCFGKARVDNGKVERKVMPKPSFVLCAQLMLPRQPISKLVMYMWFLQSPQQLFR